MTEDQEADAVANAAMRTFYMISKRQRYFQQHGASAPDSLRDEWLKEAAVQWPYNGGHPYEEKP